MKTNRLLEIARPITLAAIAIAALTLTTDANAQYKGGGDRGIAASPKVQQMLNERMASTRPAVVAVPDMACPKCADVLITEVNRQAKGGQVLAGTATQKVAKHTCTACETKLTVAGEGKAKHTVAIHKCVADVPNPATCCASS
jgi:hypothetical protein